MALPDGIGWPLRSNRIRRGIRNHTFGMVRRNADGSLRPHQGWDFAAVNGTPCFAIANGEVAALREIGDYGRQIILRFRFDRDGDGKADVLFALYAHLSRIDVVAGQKVAKHQQLGLTGSTGNAASMKPVDQHLHFELRSEAQPGRGLYGRYTPLEVFGHCPLHRAVIEQGVAS